MAPAFDEQPARKGPGRWTVRVLALALATVTWYGIHEITSFELVVRDIRLDVLLDSGWAVYDTSASAADVLFRGTQSDIRNLNRDQLSIEVDLRGKAASGAVTVPLGPEQVRGLVGNARPVGVSPHNVMLTLDRESDRTIPVRADVQGVLPDGYEFTLARCVPEAVTIHGPEARLRPILSLKTEPVDLAGRTASFEVERAIRPPPGGWKARILPEKVAVFVTVTRATTRRITRDMPVRAFVSPDRPVRVVLAPDRVRVDFQVREDVAQGEAWDTLKAFVDCSSLAPGAGMELPVRLPALEGVRVLSIQPPLIRVEPAP